MYRETEMERQPSKMMEELGALVESLVTDHHSSGLGCTGYHTDRSSLYEPVTINNTTGRGFSDVGSVADPATTIFGNFDGHINGGGR